MAETLLDVKGLKCPLPVLRARKALKPLAPGDLLEVQATDPSAVQDFASFCETTGNELVASEQDGETYVFKIRKVG